LEVELKKLFIVSLLVSVASVFGSSQHYYDGDDGIHHPNSTKISYSVHQKAVRDTGSSHPNALQLQQARDALAQKPGTLVYKYEQEKKADKN
jgi:hypothetical protein